MQWQCEVCGDPYGYLGRIFDKIGFIKHHHKKSHTQDIMEAKIHMAKYHLGNVISGDCWEFDVFYVLNAMKVDPKIINKILKQRRATNASIL